MPSSAATPFKPRLLGLDLLRLLAILLVLGRHLESPPASLSAAVRLPLETWIRGGWVGVDLFFVLSGFLVSGLLFTEYKRRGLLSIGRFYMRRGWKIYPAFFALIAATVIVKFLAHKPIPAASLLSELFFLQSYVEGLWNHTWSLAVEEHFYLLLPLTMAVILRWNRGAQAPLRPMLVLAIAAMFVTLGLRLLNAWLRPSFVQLTHLFASHLRLDSLLVGVAISYAYHFHAEPFTRRLTPWRKALMVGGILLLVPAFAFELEATPFIYTVGLTVFQVGSGMLLVGVLLSDIPRHRAVTALAGLGAASYSIYLWHMAALVWGVRFLELVRGGPLPYGIRMAAYGVGAFVLGLVMAKLVEMPALRLRDRWFPSRSPGAIEQRTTQVQPQPLVQDPVRG